MHNPREIVIRYDGKEKVMEFIPATDEQFVVREVLYDECYDFDFGFKKDDIVLNIGGHIGSFDVFAYDRVKKIITFEPCKESYDKLTKHLIRNNIYNVRAYLGAVVGDDRETTKLDLLGSGHNTTATGKGEDVVAFNIDAIFKNNEFTKIKCDCEGAEYEIFLGKKIPDTVNEMMFELHFFSDEQHEQCDKMCEGFEKQGFKLTRVENDAPLNRTFILKAKR